MLLNRQMINWLSFFAIGELAWAGAFPAIKEMRKQQLKLKGWKKEHGPHALHYNQV